MARQMTNETDTRTTVESIGDLAAGTSTASTVRGLLAGGIVAAFLVGHLGGALMLLAGGSPEAGLALLGALALEAGTVTGFYFGVRRASA